MNTEEFNIPVPWGHVAAKAWGNENQFPVLLFHGMADNAGSFDQLIPHLPATYYYIAIDLPGHGKSSHFPQHLPLNPINVVFTYKLIVDYLKWDEYIFIGHSWGGRIAAFFAQLYPKYVLKLILLDAIYLHILSVNNFKDHNVSQIDQMIELSNTLLNKTRPSYSYEEALKKIQNSRAHGTGLSKEAAESLLTRSITAKEDSKYCLSHDIRLRTLAIHLMHGMGFSEDLVKTLPVTCPVLIIIASESLARLERYKRIITRIKSYNKKCFVKKVTGDHDVHMKQPEVVAPLINNFLKNDAQSKL